MLNIPDDGMADRPWLRALPPFVRLHIVGRQSLQQAIGNTSWLFADRILRLGLGVFVSVIVTRYLGPTNFGLLSYAGTFVALFAAFATLGLDSIVVRELVRFPERRNQLLGTAFLLKLIAGVISLASIIVGVLLLRPGDRLTQTIVGVVGLGMLFQAFDAIDFSFQAQVRSKFVVFAKSAAFVCIAIAKLVLVAFHAPLVAFAAAGLAEVALGAMGLVVAYRISGLSIVAWRGNLRLGRSLLRDSWLLMLAAGAVNIYMYIDQIMLGQIAGLNAVGVYSAAVRISELWYFVPMAIAGSLLPSILKIKALDQEQFYAYLQKIFTGMALLGYAVALPMTVFSGRITTILFGEAYAAAGPVLAIHAWTGIFVALGVTRSLWITAENLSWFSFATTALSAVVNILLNLMILSRYGAQGAALATLLSQVLAAWISCYFWKNTRPIGRMIFRALLLQR